MRRLSTKSQLVALLYGQLSGASSLREIEAGLQSHAARLYHLGAKPVRRSTLGGCQRAAAGGGVRRAVRRDDAARASRAAPGAGGDHLSDRFHRAPADARSGRVGALLGRGLRRQAARDLRSRRRPPIYAALTAPGSTTSPPPRRCRSSRAPPTSSISATTTMPGGPSSTPPAAASSPASSRTRRSPSCEDLPVPEGGDHPLRPHRLSACAPGQEPQEPVAGPGARGPRQDRDRQGAAHPDQRPRCHRQRDRRPLQAPLGHRAVLPLDQADPQDHAASSAPPRTPCASRSPSR